MTPPLWFGQIYTSPDGINWTYKQNENPNKYGECWTLYKDNDYGLIHRQNLQNFSWVDSSGVTHNTVNLREPWARSIAFTHSFDYNFPDSKLVFVPGSQDDGETQFYNVSNPVNKIAIINVLRSDLVASGITDGSYGTGYSSIAWYNGANAWDMHRGTDPHFFEPNPILGSWDHAVAWITSIVPNGDNYLLYYGGYAQGHRSQKADRQIGVLSIKKNRFVYRTANNSLMRTKLLNFNAKSMTLNANGTIRVQIFDENNVLLPYDATVSGDGVNLPVALDLSALATKAVKIGFTITGKLYGFDLL